MVSPCKRIKWNLSDTSSESKDDDINRFPKFVLEPQDDSPQANLSPFVIEKISANLKPKTIKKKNWNHLVEAEKKETCRFSAENEDFSYEKNNCLPSPKP